MEAEHGFRIKFREISGKFAYGVFAAKSNNLEPAPVFLKAGEARDYLNGRQSRRMGVVSFVDEREKGKGIWNDAFYPYKYLTDHEQGKITGNLVAARIELAVLRHLKSSVGGKIPVSHEGVTWDRTRMLEKTGRDPDKPMTIDEEIVALEKYFASKNK